MPSFEYVCAQCSSRFAELHDVQQHIWDRHHIDDWPSFVDIIGSCFFFTCGLCSYSTSYGVDYLRDHWRIEHTDREPVPAVSQGLQVPPQLENASVSTSAASNSDATSLLAFQKVGRHCGKCGGFFFNKSARNRHELKCTGSLGRPRPAKYCCGKCSEGYQNKKARDSHESDCKGSLALRTEAVVLIDDIPTETVNTCPICDRKVMYIRAHLQICHTEALKTLDLIYCKECDQPCLSNEALNLHETLNHKLKNLCSKCNKAIKNIETRDRHERKKCKVVRRPESGAEQSAQNQQARQSQLASVEVPGLQQVARGPSTYNTCSSTFLNPTDAAASAQSSLYGKGGRMSIAGSSASTTPSFHAPPHGSPVPALESLESSFEESELLDHRIPSVTEEGNYKCRICEAQFASFEVCSSHISKAHP